MLKITSKNHAWTFLTFFCVGQSQKRGSNKSCQYCVCHVITYPLAKVYMVVGGKHYSVEGAVVKKLPTSVLLG